MPSLRSIQFYRKVKDDIVEANSITGCISIFAAITMAFLFYTQLSEYLTPNREVKMVMDRSSTDKLLIAFNITMLHLPCAFASVDVADARGTHYINLSAAVAKYRVVADQDGVRQVGRHREPSIDHRINDRTPGQLVIRRSGSPMGDLLRVLAGSNGADLDWSNEFVKELNPENFEAELKSHDINMVNFYAPWCVHCQNFHPAWKQVAQEHVGKNRVMIGGVNCVDHEALCRKSNILGYPTVRVYKLGSTAPDDIYHGSREPSAIAQFVQQELQSLGDQTVVQPTKEGEAEQKVAEEQEEDRPEAYADDIDVDGAIHLHGRKKWHQINDDAAPDLFGAEGCMLVGQLLVNRAPGNFHIEARSEHHDFPVDTLNTTHFVSSLVFGVPLSIQAKRWLSPKVIQFGNTLEDTLFVSDNLGVTREHNIKVVHTTSHFTGLQEPIDMYQYTTTTTQYEEHPPAAKFVFDLSPMQIVTSETRTPLAVFVTSVCAIIGGTFTVIGLFDSVIYFLWKEIR